VKVEQLTGPVAYHGEGPVWFPGWGGLRWVDMLAGDLLSFAGDGSVRRKHVGRVAAVVRPRRRGGAIIGGARGFLLEHEDGTVRDLGQLWSDSAVRMNEGGCDPDGRFYCGSMAYAKTPGAGSLYRIDPDRSVRVVLSGVTISNGLEWSPDGSLAYYNDTPTGAISVFDYDVDHGLTDRRTFVEIADHGRPDGLTVDAEGGVWTAISNGSAVHRYTAAGELDEVIKIPASKVTACTFGGERLDELYVTTSQEGVDTSTDPLAGSLFRVDVGIAGLPVRQFAG
jgi:sugar lactone lactonase YvrE